MSTIGHFLQASSSAPEFLAALTDFLQVEGVDAVSRVSTLEDSPANRSVSMPAVEEGRAARSWGRESFGRRVRRPGLSECWTHFGTLWGVSQTLKDGL